MRKLLRSVARANMKNAKMEHLNKFNRIKGIPGDSKFARNWRRFVFNWKTRDEYTKKLRKAVRSAA